LWFLKENLWIKKQKDRRGNDFEDLSSKPIAIAAIYQREFVISLKTHQYYNKCSDNLLKPTTIAAESQRFL